MIYEGLYKNLNDMFQKRVAYAPEKTGILDKVDGVWEKKTWKEYYEIVKNVGMGLKLLGINSGDKVAILSNTRVEWTYADMGIIGIGAITVAIYQSNGASECEYILDDSDSAFIFVEDEAQLEKVKSIKGNLKFLEKAILFEGENKENLDWVLTMDELLELGKPESTEVFSKIGMDIEDTTPAAFVYTSGTTGNPKGAIITHRSLLADAEGLSKSVTRIDTLEDATTLMFLPFAHVFAKIVNILTIYNGTIGAFAESVAKVGENIIETEPHLMCSVPRIYEKIYAKIIGDVEYAGGMKKKIFYWSLGVGRQVSKCRQAQKPLPPVLQAKYQVAKRLVFNKLKEKFGSRLRFFVSSGAPLAEEIAEFFHAADVLILEAYGLTEVSGAMTINYPDKFKFGTVGPALSTADIKINEEGEILCKSPIVMKGYFKKERETREVIDDEGWFHTGDIGEIDGDGFLKITDRKKDIIITAAGKNIAPQNIENHMKGDRHISQIIVLGDKKKYLVALLNINYEQMEKYAEKHKISYENHEELSKHPKVIGFIEKIIREKNQELPSYATIKYFRIVTNEFSQETGELTSTLKVKRKYCMEKYVDLIESMYQ